jgi:hypothetical protein
MYTEDNGGTVFYFRQNFAALPNGSHLLLASSQHTCVMSSLGVVAEFMVDVVVSFKRIHV